MFNGFRLRGAWWLTVLVLWATCCPPHAALAQIQMPVGTHQLNFASPVAMMPVVPQQPMMLYAQPPVPVQRGPLARLVQNPDASNGLPPYALTDRAGAIHRYVEPMPGIDLDAYLNRIVTVRHDTGQTLLASQLDLPPQRLLPMVNSSKGGTKQSVRDRTPRTNQHADRRPFSIKRAAFVDNDDKTVQLLQDQQEEELTPPPSVEGNGKDTGSQKDAGSQIEPIKPNATTEPNAAQESCEGFPSFPEGYPSSEGEMMEGGPIDGESMVGDPMQGDLSGMEYYPGGMQGFSSGVEGYPGGMDGYVEGMEGGEIMDCPQCGRHHSGQCRTGSMWGSARMLGTGRRLGQCYGEVEFNFLRPNVMEEGVGKVSEKYELSPRFILGFQANNQIGGRVRYWTYGRSSAAPGGSVRFEFDVWDLEATRAFDMGGTGVELAAGVRLAKIGLTDVENDGVGIDLAGLTFAADGRTRLCALQGNVVSWAYGGRFSILNGDWGGDGGSDFINLPASNDNVVSEELYVGIECAKCFQNCNVHARFAFEMQNWHSDALAQSSTDSIGFIGPGVHVGAEF